MSTSIARRTELSVTKNALPEYLAANEVEVMLECAPSERARLLMLIQWRSGLRVSEAINVRWSDIRHDDRPTLRVRRGKGNKSRLVPLHPELGAAFRVSRRYQRVRTQDKIIDVGRQAASKWVKAALNLAIDRNQIAEDRKVTTHTFRHSFARHLLMHGIPINVLSRWMGHSHLDYTLRYLELLPDPTGSLASIP